MKNLEGIVRPFQFSPQFTARFVVPQPAVPPATDTAEISWIGGADTSIAPAPTPVTVSFKTVWKEDLKSRKYTTVRVHNPNDANQYVDVQRLDKMKFDHYDAAWIDEDGVYHDGLIDSLFITVFDDGTWVTSDQQLNAADGGNDGDGNGDGDDGADDRPPGYNDDGYDGDGGYDNGGGTSGNPF